MIMTPARLAWGMKRAAEPKKQSMTATSMPAIIPAMRVFALDSKLMAERVKEPDDAKQLKKEPTIFASPWPMNSRFALIFCPDLRDMDFAIESASTRPIRAMAKALLKSAVIFSNENSGTVNLGRWAGISPMSLTPFSSRLNQAVKAPQQTRARRAPGIFLFIFLAVMMIATVSPANPSAYQLDALMEDRVKNTFSYSG